MQAREQLRVLIVDDDRDTVDSFVMLMNFWGHSAFAAHDGAEALAVARKQRLDAALIDLAMPGQDGLSLAKAFRGKIPLLCAVTGYADDRRKRKCQEAGFDAVFVKPVEPEWLRRMLADAAEAEQLRGRTREAKPALGGVLQTAMKMVTRSVQPSGRVSVRSEIIGLNEAEESFRKQYRNEPWFVGVTTDRERGCLRVVVRNYAVTPGQPLGVDWKHAGIRVWLYPADSSQS